MNFTTAKQPHHNPQEAEMPQLLTHTFTFAHTRLPALDWSQANLLFSYLGCSHFAFCWFYLARDGNNRRSTTLTAGPTRQCLIVSMPCLATLTQSAMPGYLGRSSVMQGKLCRLGEEEALESTAKPLSDSEKRFCSLIDVNAGQQSRIPTESEKERSCRMHAPC